MSKLPKKSFYISEWSVITIKRKFHWYYYCLVTDKNERKIINKILENKKEWKTCPIRYKMYYDAMQTSSMILAQKEDNYTKDIKYNPKKKDLRKRFTYEFSIW